MEKGIFNHLDRCDFCFARLEPNTEHHCDGLDEFNREQEKVNHPKHYTFGKIETIDYIEDKQLNYHLGNAVKYISRAGKKSDETYIEDLKKAVWYINREIQRKEKLNGQNTNNSI